MPDSRKRFLAEAERFRAERGGDAVAALRVAAGAHFADVGFPTTRLEEWRFTNIAPIAETEFLRATNGETHPGLPALLDELALGEVSARLVFVNGRFAPRLSSVADGGLRAGSLAQAIADEPETLAPYLGRLAAPDASPFAALNTAFLHDGAFLRVVRGAVIGRPVHLLFVATAGDRPVASHPRVLVIAGENSQLSLIETYGSLGEGITFTNGVTEIAAGPGAVVDHYKVLRESLQAYHTATIQARLDRAASVFSHNITLGGALVRNDTNAVLDGEGAECTLNGLYLVNGRRLVDNHTLIDHARPHCASHELYKGILDGQARAVFNGKIVVRPDAQKTDAKQTNKALLLSEDAQINTKPQLEIFADDVKCTHGATVGQLDQEALFYLRARGLSAGRARSLLIHAFAADVLTRLKLPAIRAQLDVVMLEQLPVSAEDEVCYEQPD